MSNDNNNSIEKRASWSSKAEFVLTYVGYAVGLGNIWRFPYMCYKNGGGAFLVPYLLSVCLIGIPMVCLEFAIGQYSGLGIIKLWDICPLFKGMGVSLLFMNTIICIYYTTIIAITLLYMVQAFSPQLPWIGCNHTWNSPQCYDVINSIKESVSACNISMNMMNSNITRITPAEEYMVNEVYNLSEGVTDIGSINWKLWLCIVAVWVMIYLVTIRGVKSFGKVFYFTSLVPYLMLTILFIQGLMLPGSIDGLRYYLVPDWSKLQDPKVWFSAAQQVFYSQGIALGCFITMSSFNNFNNNFIRHALIATTVNSATSLYCGLAVFSILGFIAKESCQSVEDVISSGPGFTFIAYPRALALLPFPQMWSVIFFFTLVLIGISCQVVHFETVISCITDHFPKLRSPSRRMLVSLLCMLIFIVAGTIFATEGGMYFFTLVDWFAVPLAMMIIAILECIVIAWIYGSGKLCKSITEMVGSHGGPLLPICWKFITPTFIFVILVINMITWQNVTFRGYTYPDIAVFIGWVLMIGVMLPILLVAVYTFISTKFTSPESGLNTICKLILEPSEAFKKQVTVRSLKASNVTDKMSVEMKLFSP